MTSTRVDQPIETLTEESPSYMELLDLYRSLQEPTDAPSDEVVARRALAQVVGEFIDYLDLVSQELEKSVGLTRAEERRRLLGALEPPAADDPIARVNAIIEQWDDVDRYGYKEQLSENPELTS